MKCSRLNIWILLFIMLLYFITFCNYVLVEYFIESVWMRVRYFVICLRNSGSIGRSSISCYKTVIDVVLKYSMIIFMVKCYIDIKLIIWVMIEEFRVFSDLYQIAASYWVLDLIIAIYNLLIYLNVMLHVILVMLDNVKANLVSFLVMYFRCEWNFSFWSKIMSR